MLGKQTFEDNIYMKWCTKIYEFFVGNICFIALILPFTLSALFLAIDVHNTLPFVISLITLFPAIGAFFSFLTELRGTNGVIHPFKLFLKAWYRGAGKNFIIGLIGFFVNIIVIANILFWWNTSFIKWLLPCLLLALIIWVGTSINFCYFYTINPKNTFFDLLKVSFFFVVRKWYFTLLNVAMLVFMLCLVVLKPQFGMIITPIIFIGLIYLNCTKLYPPKTQTSSAI